MGAVLADVLAGSCGDPGQEVHPVALATARHLAETGVPEPRRPELRRLLDSDRRLGTGGGWRVLLFDEDLRLALHRAGSGPGTAATR
jgi:hypothetical protein